MNRNVLANPATATRQQAAVLLAAVSFGGGMMAENAAADSQVQIGTAVSGTCDTTEVSNGTIERCKFYENGHLTEEQSITTRLFEADRPAGHTVDVFTRQRTLHYAGGKLVSTTVRTKLSRSVESDVHTGLPDSSKPICYDDVNLSTANCSRQTRQASEDCRQDGGLWSLPVSPRDPKEGYCTPQPPSTDAEA